MCVDDANQARAEASNAEKWEKSKWPQSRYGRQKWNKKYRKISKMACTFWAWSVFAIWSIIDASNQSGNIKMEIESYLKICFPCYSNGTIKCNDITGKGNKNIESKWKIRVPNDVYTRRCCPTAKWLFFSQPPRPLPFSGNLSRSRGGVQRSLAHVRYSVRVRWAQRARQCAVTSAALRYICVMCHVH